MEILNQLKEGMFIIVQRKGKIGRKENLRIIRNGYEEKLENMDVTTSSAAKGKDEPGGKSTSHQMGQTGCRTG